MEECSDLVAKADELRWQERLALKPKLHWYCQNKRTPMREAYLDLVKNFHHRRHVLQLRAGAYLLRVEYGRIDGLPRKERLCLLCCAGEVENEHHFLLDCPAFANERKAAWSRFFWCDSTQQGQTLQKALCVPEVFREEIREQIVKEGRKPADFEKILQQRLIASASFVHALCHKRETFRRVEAAASRFWCSRLTRK